MITTNAVLVGKFQGPGNEILHRLPIGSSDTLIHQPISQVGTLAGSQHGSGLQYIQGHYIYIYIIAIIIIVVM